MEQGVDNDGYHELLLPIINEENQCLPLPINVVSKYWNVELSLDEAKKTAKKYTGFNGSILIEGIELAERYGLGCKIVNSTISELKKIIDSGMPPIVILPGVPEITQHASIVMGYNDNNDTILHYVQKDNKDGEQQEGVIPNDIFDKEWSEEGRLLIILAPTEILNSTEFENDSSDKSNRLCFVAERLNILKNHTSALETLKQAIKLDSNNSTALHIIGSILNGQNSKECVSFYEQCLKINNRSYLSCNGLGNFYLKTDQFDKAEDYYTKAITINPKRSAKIYKNRAYIRDKQNKKSDAKNDLKNYLKCFPQAPDRKVIEKTIQEM